MNSKEDLTKEDLKKLIGVIDSWDSLYRGKCTKYFEDKNGVVHLTDKDGNILISMIKEDYQDIIRYNNKK